MCPLRKVEKRGVGVMEEKSMLSEMPFKQVMGLNKAWKMFAIESLIEAIVEDKEHEITAYYSTENKIREVE